MFSILKINVTIDLLRLKYTIEILFIHNINQKHLRSTLWSDVFVSGPEDFQQQN